MVTDDDMSVYVRLRVRIPDSDAQPGRAGGEASGSGRSARLGSLSHTVMSRPANLKPSLTRPGLVGRAAGGTLSDVTL